jgi:hypothetical protein
LGRGLQAELTVLCPRDQPSYPVGLLCSTPVTAACTVGTDRHTIASGLPAGWAAEPFVELRVAGEPDLGVADADDLVGPDAGNEV